MIRYDHFSKRFGDVTAVRELDLELRAGETLALIGPNGSGKTTTLKAALGLVRPTAGRVLVDGADAARAGREARGRLGYLPQRLAFPDGCTAREIMRLYARLRGAEPRQVDALLERVSLDEAADRAVDGYSGGMRQRLGLAVALLGAPSALILDEPTAALDPSGALLVRELIAGVRADGLTVLLSSHDLGEVGALADRLAVFVDGALAALGSPAELVRGYELTSGLRVRLATWHPDALRAAERGGARRVAREGDALVCEVAPGEEAAVLEALRASGARPAEISVSAPGIEDIYRRAARPRGTRSAA